MPKSKKNIKVRDLKPNKDAKGGGGFKPTGPLQGGSKESGAGMGANQGGAKEAGTGMN